jgi:hypothetical protein
MSRRFPLYALLTLALLLLAPATPALAGAFVSLDGDALVYDGTVAQGEADNVTISQDGDAIVLEERASRMSAVPACDVTETGYRVVCPALGVARLLARTSDLGSDVRILADLPAEIHGGAGDDNLYGGPADDTIDGGAGQDVIGGGLGADQLSGGSGKDLVTYADRIAPNRAAQPRNDGVRVVLGAPGASGEPGEGDTIATDVEQLQGTNAPDVFDLRDGIADEVLCGGGRDLVVADPRDDPGIDCETTRVAPSPLDGPMRIPTLVFPFTGHADRGGGSIQVAPMLPLQGGAVVLRVHCPVAIGLLDITGPGCRGTLRLVRDRTTLGSRHLSIPRDRTITVRVPLSRSRALARRASGLAVTAIALPTLGRVERQLHFRVRG